MVKWSLFFQSLKRQLLDFLTVIHSTVVNRTIMCKLLTVVFSDPNVFGWKDHENVSALQVTQDAQYVIYCHRVLPVTQHEKRCSCSFSSLNLLVKFKMEKYRISTSVLRLLASALWPHVGWYLQYHIKLQIYRFVTDVQCKYEIRVENSSDACNKKIFHTELHIILMQHLQFRTDGKYITNSTFNCLTKITRKCWNCICHAIPTSN